VYSHIHIEAGKFFSKKISKTTNLGSLDSGLSELVLLKIAQDDPKMLQVKLFCLKKHSGRPKNAPGEPVLLKKNYLGRPRNALIFFPNIIDPKIMIVFFGGEIRAIFWGGN